MNFVPCIILTIASAKLSQVGKSYNVVVGQNVDVPTMRNYPNMMKCFREVA